MQHNDNAELAWQQAEQPPKGKSWDAPNANYRPAKLKVIHPASLQGLEIPKRKWIVEGLIPSGSVTMLNGDGGVGKSLLSLQLMIAAATGREWLGLPTMKAKSFGLFCEDDEDEIHRRLDDVTRHYQIQLGDLEQVEIVSRVGADNALAEYDQFTSKGEASPFYIDLMNHVIESGAQIVVLDSLHDLFIGNENNRSQARQFVGFLRELAMQIDGAVILNAHPSQSGMATGSGASGSTAWNNSVRSRLYLTRPKIDDGPEDTDTRVLSTKKSNYGPVGDDLALRWSLGAFERVYAPTGVLKAIEDGRAERAFLACLDAINEQGRYVTDARNSARYAPACFVEMTHSDGRSAVQFEGAMKSLFASGRIIVGAVAGENRHTRKCIIRAAPSAPSPEASH